MRSYGTEPQVWGGTDPDCQHEWGDETVRLVVGNNAGIRGADASEAERKRWARNKPQEDGNQHAIRSGNICRRCHAWRGELGQEPVPDCLGWARGEPPEACTQACFICHLRLVMAGLKRVLRDDGLCFVELGDGYNNRARVRVSSHQPALNGVVDGSWRDDAAAGRCRMTRPGIPEKSLLLVPERFRLAMLADGWTVRSVVRWAKKAPMPESCRDRFTSAVSEVVMLSKGSRYYSDFETVKERTEPWNSAKGFSPNGQAQRNIEGRIGNRDDKEQSGRNPRNYAFLDPDDDEWMPPPDWVHLSPEPSKLSHYASFGPKAIAPFLKLATSERGACAECGAAWERNLSKASGGTIGQSWHDISADERLLKGNVKMGGGTISKMFGPYSPPTTTGWRSRCQCQAETVPCRTLDCFGGSGTVAVVSEKLGLDCTLIDLSPDYVGMAALRLQLEGAPLFANANGHDDGAGGLEQTVMALGDGR